MNRILSIGVLCISLLLTHGSALAQGPNLGSTSSFALFTAAGAFNNSGATTVIGDIGTNVGAFAGFPPGIVFGNIHVADQESAQAAIDVANAYAELAAYPCGQVIGTTLGNGQVLSPNTYCLGAASSLNGNLVLDGECDPNSEFVFKIDGAFSTSSGSTITLINSASICNVFWQVNGAVSLGTNSVVRGTFLINGAISMSSGAALLGRGLSTAGAIELDMNYVDIDTSPEASTISAGGPTTFCAGGSVVLSGNCGGVWNTGQTTPTITVTTSGDYFVNNTNSCGSATSNVITVTVSAGPVCTISGLPTFCTGLSTVLCAQTGAVSYLWSNGQTTNCITVTVGGTYTVTATDNIGCTNVCSQVVTELPNPICTITGDLVICDGESTDLCAPSGYAGYLWSTGQLSNCISVNLAGLYSITVTDIVGCSSVCSVIIDVLIPPICTITGDQTICDGQSTDFCAPAGYAAYIWSNGQTTNCINVSAAGSYSVTVTDSDGCTSVCSITLIVNPLPICTISGDDFICAGSSTDLCAPSGYTSYLWSNGQTTNCITVSAAGSYSVTVTDIEGCMSVCSITVTVNPLPNCSITGDLTICDGESTDLCAPSGYPSYLWSNGQTSNCISVSLAGSYSVTVTDAFGCSNVCSVIIDVFALPICTISGDQTICDGQSTDFCAPTGLASYLWSNGATTNCINVNIAGIYSVTVTNSDGCTSVCSVTLTINSLPICTISGDDFICDGSSTDICAPAGYANYLWSNGQTTNCINVTQAGIFSVTVTDVEGCTNVCSITISINPLPNCTITGDNTICDGASTDLCTPTGYASYLWSNGQTTNCISVSLAGTYSVTVTDALGCSNVCSITVDIIPPPVCTISGNPSFCEGLSTDLCAPAGASSYLWSTGETTNCITVNLGGIFSVTVTNSEGCSSVCSITISVDPIPICIITGKDDFCNVGEIITLCAATGASSYLWSTGETSICIDITNVGTYSVTVTNAEGCTNSCSKTLTFQPLPDCVISGEDFLCEDGQTIEICTPPGAASYLWSTGATTNCIMINTAGTYSVTITDQDGCISTCSKTIIIDPFPECIISGPDFLCEEGQAIDLCVPSGASTYLWSTGATTNCITINMSGTYSVTVTNTNGCQSICSKIITVNPIENCQIDGLDSLCTGQSIEICGLPLGYNYVWSTGQTTRCINVSTGGTYTLTISNSAGCTSVCSKTIVENIIPDCSISGDDVICEGQTTELCTLPGASAYLWSTGATTNCITVSLPGIYLVTVTGANGCFSVCSIVINVNPLPNCLITGDSLICNGLSTEFCAPTGYASYLWSNGETSNCVTVSLAGIYTLTVTDLNGCSSVCSIPLNLLPTPTCSITGDSLLCDGTSTDICAIAGYASYLWSNGETSNCITVSLPGIYTVTVTDLEGCTSSCSIEILTAGQPICNITGKDNFCNNAENITLCATAGATSYLWSTGAISQCITVNTVGTYTVTVTNAAGCTNSCSKTLGLQPIPDCLITGDSSICELGQNIQLCTPSGSASYLWSTGETTNCIIVNTPGTYSVTITDVNGCFSFCNKTIVLDSMPVCQITGPDFICFVGQNIDICVPAGNNTYLWNTGATTNCITVNLPGTYSVSITNSNGCVSICSTIVELRIFQACQIIGNPLICPEQTTRICAFPLGLNYLWNTGEITDCIDVSLAGTYTLTVTNTNGCTSVCSINIINAVPPICVITGNNEICEGESTLLCASPGNAQYLWSTGQTSSCITVRFSGIYSVTVTAANGCQSVCTKVITVHPLPICIISGPNSICLAGQSIEICGFPVTGSYLWNTGQTSRCITVNQAGTYTMTITNEFGCESICNKVIKLDSTPVCLITGDDFICEIGKTARLCVAAGALNYKWSTGQNTNCITVNIAGTFSVTVTHVNGCVSICSKTILLNPNPTCLISGNDYLCEIGSTTRLCVTAGALAYKWNTGQTTACIDVNTAGTYSVTVTYSDSCVSTCSIFVRKQAAPDCLITGENSICEPGKIIQLCVPAGAMSYKWNTGSNNRCIDISLPGTYRVTVTFANGCISTCSKTITLDSVAQCIISGNDLLCQPGSSTVLCSNREAKYYLWSTGDTTRCITVNQVGTYSLTITNDNGCKAICSKIVSTKSMTPCVITGNRFICKGDYTLLCAPAECAEYYWSTGDTTSCIIVRTIGTYYVTVTDKNGCTSVCSATVIDSLFGNCIITGITNVCNGQPTLLCAPADCASYLWSTGEKTPCIIARTPGTYSVTVTNKNGCISICSVVVTSTILDSCLITGILKVCQGQPTLLCAPADCATYLWSTGAKTPCILVKTAGMYHLTVTNKDGCVSYCCVYVAEDVAPPCLISGITTVCSGQPTLLCVDPNCAGYRWSTGDTTPCIIVRVGGMYSVTITNKSGCESTCCIWVTETLAPSCLITGNNFINPGQFTSLCAPANYAGYSWSNGAKTACISVWTPGMYTVTVTDKNGCESVCCIEVFSLLVNQCFIAGADSACFGQPVLLCGPSECVSYLWSTGAKTSCILVNGPGTYLLTIVDSLGIQKTCSHTVHFKAPPICNITGKDTICMGSSNQLCTPYLTGAKYLWNTGDSSNCILVDSAGIYSVTVTRGGCSSSCSVFISSSAGPISKISGNLIPTFGKNTLLCAPPDQKSYLWSNGARTSCISVKSGIYSVTVTNALGCSSSSWVRVVSMQSQVALADTTSADKPKEKISINIYPNPTDDKATIEILNLVAGEIVNVELYTLSGIRLFNVFEQFNHKENNSSTVLNAETLSDGIYICRIIHGDEIVNKKISIIK